MLRFASAAAAALLLSAAPALAQSGPSSLTLTFDTGSRAGSVMVALYDNAAAFDAGADTTGSRAVARTAVTASGGFVARFDNLPAGDYAAKAFHDLNGDGQMNFDAYGRPTEPYAFSNNASGNMGPARWSAAHFTVSGPTAQTLSLR